MEATAPRRVWIQGPFTDLVFFSFGWIVALAAFVAADRAGIGPKARPVLFAVILLFNFLHRHLTFPLIYGDPEQFRARRGAYLLVPAVCVAVTAAAVLLVRPAGVEGTPVAAPLRIAPGSGVDFFVLEEKGVRRLQARFTGAETAPEAAAEAIHRQLGGVLAAEAAGGRIAVRAPDGTRFYLGAAGPLEALGLRGAVGRLYEPSRPYLTLLVVLSVLWTIFHTMMQKVGLLRVYGRKAGVTDGPWIDRAFVFSWLVFIFFHLGTRPELRAQVAAVSSTGRALKAFLESFPALLPGLSIGALAIAVAATVLYLRREIARPGPFEWPKNLYALSILGLYAGFYYDVIAGYAVFAFSHAIEYLAFVNAYARKKYLARPAESSFLARAVRRQALAMGAFVLVVAGSFLLWRTGSETTLHWYIVATGWLHFLYDGWIWKVRAPEVGRPLGIAYAASN